MTWRRIASIEIRLTLILGVIAFVVSVVAGCTLFLALQREVQRQEMTEVSGKFELIDQHYENVIFLTDSGGVRTATVAALTFPSSEGTHEKSHDACTDCRGSRRVVDCR